MAITRSENFGGIAENFRQTCNRKERLAKGTGMEAEGCPLMCEYRKKRNRIRREKSRGWRKGEGGGGGGANEVA